jgi:hypothetical protein
MQYINTETVFEKKHFNPDSSTVLPHAVNIRELLGFHLDDLSIKRLSGAPTGSQLEIVHKSAWNSQELLHEKVPSGLYFLVENPAYLFERNTVGLFHDGDSKRIGVYVKLVAFKNTAPKRVAARMLAIIAREALALPGITRIRLCAAGGRRWSPLDRSTGARWGGYVAWPTYGFDMPLLPRTKTISRHFPYWPPAIGTCKTVSDILQTSGGREYWKTVGDGWYMDFDLSSTASPSLRTLNGVLESAGV